MKKKEKIDFLNAIKAGHSGFIAGNPAHAFGMNVEGMRRKGWSKNVIQGLREAFKLIYKANLTTEQAMTKIREEILPEVAEVQLLIDSVEQSKRGIVR